MTKLQTEFHLSRQDANIMNEIIEHLFYIHAAMTPYHPPEVTETMDRFKEIMEKILAHFKEAGTGQHQHQTDDMGHTRHSYGSTGNAGTWRDKRPHETGHAA